MLTQLLSLLPFQRLIYFAAEWSGSEFCKHSTLYFNCVTYKLYARHEVARILEYTLAICGRLFLERLVCTAHNRENVLFADQISSSLANTFVSLSSRSLLHCSRLFFLRSRFVSVNLQHFTLTV